MAKNPCIRVFVMDEKKLSDQNEEATEDNEFANKTFLSIDERFALNARSMLDQTMKSKIKLSLQLEILQQIK